jgi:hypothetical protein
MGHRSPVPIGFLPLRGRNSDDALLVVHAMRRGLFRYPDLVNENAARLIAGGVVVMVVAYLVSGSGLVLAALAYGFVARVLTGPTLSPVAQFVNRVIVPWFRVPVKPIPGPPKRFAQGMGAVLSLGALAAQAAGAETPAFVLVGAIGVAATLESVFAFCIGCRIFAMLMAIGLVPPSVCEACSDLSGARSSAGA